MPPAARVGDQTAHGTMLVPVPGSLNVFIDGKPACRAGDFHVCSMIEPSTTAPHVGGLVSPGSSTVLINGKPAARMGDQINEVGVPPNSITGGCPTVNIG